MTDLGDFEPRRRRRVSIPREAPPLTTMSAPSSSYVSPINLPPSTPWTNASNPLPLPSMAYPPFSPYAPPYAAPSTYGTPYASFQPLGGPAQTPYQSFVPIQSAASAYPPFVYPQAQTPYTATTQLYPTFSPVMPTTAPPPGYPVFVPPMGGLTPGPVISPPLPSRSAPTTPNMGHAGLPQPAQPTVPSPYAPPSILSGGQPTPAFEPGVYPPVPFGTNVPIRLPPALVYNLTAPNIPRLIWDIIHPPESARMLNGRDNPVVIDLNALATEPGVTSVWIESDHEVLKYWMQVWGEIAVETDEPITIKVLLQAIWEYLQEPLRKREVRMLKEVSGNWENLTYAAHKRAEESYGLRDVNLEEGFRRVDVLGAHRKYAGMRVQIEPDHTWKLFMGLLPGPVPKLNF